MAYNLQGRTFKEVNFHITAYYLESTDKYIYVIQAKQTWYFHTRRTKTDAFTARQIQLHQNKEVQTLLPSLHIYLSCVFVLVRRCTLLSVLRRHWCLLYTNNDVLSWKYRGKKNLNLKRKQTRKVIRWLQSCVGSSMFAVFQNSFQPFSVLLTFVIIWSNPIFTC